MVLRQMLIALRARRTAYRVAIDFLFPRLHLPGTLANIHAPTVEHLDREQQKRQAENDAIEEARHSFKRIVWIAAVTAVVSALWIATG
jgi:hypothetical protein